MSMGPAATAAAAGEEGDREDVRSAATASSCSSGDSQQQSPPPPMPILDVLPLRVSNHVALEVVAQGTSLQEQEGLSSEEEEDVHVLESNRSFAI